MAHRSTLGDWTGPFALPITSKAERLGEEEEEAKGKEDEGTGLRDEVIATES